MNADIRRCNLSVQIAGAVLTSGNAVIAYRTEWNGLDALMPMDHWLECDGQRIDLSKLGWEWGEEDLALLEQTGALLLLRQWTDPQDKFDRTCWYLTNVVPRDPADEAVALLQAARALVVHPANVFIGCRWTSPSDGDAEIAGAIEALRSGSDVPLSAWSDPDGDFVRVGAANGWAASARTLAEQMREALRAIASRRPTVPAPQVGAVQSAASVRRELRIVNLMLADLVLHLVLFAALIGLPPNPLNDLVQDWVLARGNPHGGFGTIHTEAIFWGSFVGVLLLIFGQLGVAVLVYQVGRLFTGKRAVATAQAAPHVNPASARVDDAQAALARADERVRPKGYYERWTALAIAIATPAVAGVLLLTDTADRSEARSAALTVVPFSSSAALRTLGQHVTVRAVARRDSWSAVREHTTFHGKVVDTLTTFSGVRSDFDRPLPDDEVIVPLSPIDADNHQAIQLFWHAKRSADPSLYSSHAAYGPAPGAEVSLAGTLHERALPRFVVNSYRRAGVEVAEDYFVLEPELSDSDRLFRRVVVLGAGWAIAALVFVWPMLVDLKQRRRNKEPAKGSARGTRQSRRSTP